MSIEHETAKPPRTVTGDDSVGFDDRAAFASTAAAQARLDADIAASGGLEAWRARGTVTGDGASDQILPAMAQALSVHRR